MGRGDGRGVLVLLNTCLAVRPYTSHPYNDGTEHAGFSPDLAAFHREVCVCVGAQLRDYYKHGMGITRGHVHCCVLVAIAGWGGTVGGTVDQCLLTPRQGETRSGPNWHAIVLNISAALQ